ncbi:MAG: class I SAM-dependent methyltransferase [bacterium]
MTDDIEQSISDSLEADKKLLGYMPFLLQDMWALGCSVEDIVAAVGSLHLAPESIKILDLGCGKGAVCVRVASEYQLKAVGVDAMSAFLQDAVHKAEEYHVSHLCQFVEQDIRKYVSAEHNFDVVVLASLGGILGSVKNTVSKLRTQIRSDGYMIIDDGYLRGKSTLDRKGYEHYRNHEETVRELTRSGDHLVREINTTDISRKINDKYLNLIKKRGVELVDKHPDLKENIRSFIQYQSEDCYLINNQIEGALWVVQKRE